MIDASGNGSRIHNAVGGQRQYSEFFRNIAVFSYFEGAGRLPEPDSGNILSAAFDRGWIWFIPLSDELTSVGVVVSVDDAEAIQANPDAALRAMIDQCPAVRQYLGDAKRSTTPPYDEVRVRRDYSYERTALWRPGMVVVGDAAMFIDPVFSSGVHLSTYSALLAARAVNTTLAGLADEAACLAEFDSRYRREFAVFRDFLVAFYKMNVDEQSYYWQAKQIAQHDGSVLEAFVDLVGGMMPADLMPPGGMPPEARTMPIPPAMVGAVGMSMELGIRDMNGTLGSSPMPVPPMAAGLLPSSNGLRWEVPQGWAADQTATAHATGS